MLNTLRPVFNRLTEPVANALARTPVTPNAITITGTVGVAAGALALFPTGHLFAGTLVCWFFVMADMLDGALARVKGTTGTFGAFLDSTLDRVADASVFAGLAAWFVLGGHSRLLAGVALFCLVSGALVSYAKARAEGLGIRCDVGRAERTGAALYPAILWYEGEHWGIHVDDEIPVPAEGSRRQKVADMTQALARSFEAAIRAHPADWHMLQRVFIADLDPERLAAADARTAAEAALDQAGPT
jgi:CDP-diacylglycerol--glycerol-3-phosphate 3-phosphatidyltransferase